jgi:hypothetical protein
MPTITLTRQQFYDRAWTTPLDALARELGLSGRGLGKLCDRHDIPVLPPGMVGQEGRRASSTANTSAGAECGDGDEHQVYRADRILAEKPEEPQLHPLVAFEQQSGTGVTCPTI